MTERFAGVANKTQSANVFRVKGRTLSKQNRSLGTDLELPQ